jgi:hypothetical protein
MEQLVFLALTHSVTAAAPAMTPLLAAKIQTDAFTQPAMELVLL